MLKNILKILGVGTVLLFIAITGINFYVLSFSKNNIYGISEKIEGFEIGIVLGASVYNNKTPSPILKDRLKVAYEAYKSGKISKIIVSGDNGKKEYNEPVVMQKYLMELGVKEADIYLDYAGFDTYDTLYRARDIFGVKKAILFTQEFHLKRALYIADRLGIETVGIQTDLQPYLYIGYYNRREVLSRVKAFLEVEILKAKPKFGGEEIKIITNDEIDKAKQDLLNK